VTTYRFTGPFTQRKHTGKCPSCGKKVTRTLTFEHTVNPFNRHPTEDRPKTWDEVQADVTAKADAWKPDFTCQACESATELGKATVDQLIQWIYHESRERYDHHYNGKPSRAALCNQRIAVYENRIVALDPGLVDWPTSSLYDRDSKSLRSCCYYEFPDGQRCVYSRRHGAGYHLSPNSERVTLGVVG
jgi:hypothetical protein